MAFTPLSKSLHKQLAQLRQKKYREQRQEFLAEGVRLCYELLRSPLEAKMLIFSERLLHHPKGPELLNLAEERKLNTYQTNEDMLHRLGDTEEPQPVMICARMRQHEFSPSTFIHAKRLLALVNLADPGNLGTILRTAEAFGWDGVWCLGNTIDFYNPKVMRASMGSLFRLNLACSPLEMAKTFCEQTGITPILTLPEQGQNPPYTDLPSQLILFLGSEAHGLPDSLVLPNARKFQLPMSSSVESLNVAVAAGIMLFLLRVEKKE